MSIKIICFEVNSFDTFDFESVNLRDIKLNKGKKYLF